MSAMSHKTTLMYLTRRADYLAQRIAEAEAVGRAVTWDKGELLALQAAITRLTETDPQDGLIPQGHAE
jgi:hypothetical protein